MIRLKVKLGLECDCCPLIGRLSKSREIFTGDCDREAFAAAMKQGWSFRQGAARCPMCGSDEVSFPKGVTR